MTVAFVWSKKTVNGKTVSNLAPWTLKNCELCLMGTLGRMVQYKQKNNIPQLVEAVRTRHSEKPEEVRRRIEELFGDVPGSNSLPGKGSTAGTVGETRCKSWQQHAAEGSSPPSAHYGRSRSRPSSGSRTKTFTGSCTGRPAKESMKKLTQGEITDVARVLQNMKDSAARSTGDKRTDEGGNPTTERQRRKIYALTEALGWNNDKRRIEGFVKRMTGIDRLEWLNTAQCEKVIEGLKAILAREQRKGAGRDG